MLIEDLRLFVIVSECGTFSAAASVARTTPSTVSRRIAALEDDMGVRLLSRTTRRLALTSEGRMFLDRCRPLLLGIEEVRDKLRQARETPAGLVRISSSAGFGGRYVAPLMGECRRRHPAVWIDLRLEDRYVDLAADEADIAIRIGRLPDRALRVVRLASLGRIACASPDYLAMRGRPERPADLSTHECIQVGTLGRSGGAWSFRDAGTLKIAPGFSVSSHEAAATAAVAGAGVAHLPSWLVAAELAQGRLERLLHSYEIPGDGGVWLVWQHRPPARVRAVVDFLRKHLAVPGSRD